MLVISYLSYSGSGLLPIGTLLLLVGLFLRLICSRYRLLFVLVGTETGGRLELALRPHGLFASPGRVFRRFAVLKAEEEPASELAPQFQSPKDPAKP